MDCVAWFTIVDGDDSSGSRVLRARGELDLAAAPLLMEAIARCADDSAVVLDMSEVGFIDAAGIGALAAAAEVVAGSNGTFTIRNPSSPVGRLVRLVGLEATLPIEGEGAVASGQW